jgi:t-SNARE syntaxin family protein
LLCSEIPLDYNNGSHGSLPPSPSVSRPLHPPNPPHNQTKPADASITSEVLSTLNTTRPLFSSYLRIRSLAKSPSNPELQQSRSELETTLTDLTADLDDLVESVRAVEQDPYRYGLELEEVQRRRQLVDDVGAEIENMRQELHKVVASSDAHAHAAAGGGPGSGGGLPNPAEFDSLASPGEGGGDDYYAEMEQQRQLELMHEQDEQLDGVFRTVGNLRQQADDMGRELEEQAVMIGEVDTLADRVGGKLQSGMSKLKYIIRKNEGELRFLDIGVEGGSLFSAH